MRRAFAALIVGLFVGCTPFQASQDAGRDVPGDLPTIDLPAAGDADAADRPITCAVMTDPRNCGTCGHECATLPNVSPNATVECRAGACWVAPAGCMAGFAHCTTVPDDGCETSISRPESCGSCGTVCKADAPLCASTGATQTCVSTCSAPSPDKCGAKCVDTQTDPANCGACGNICSFPNAEAACVKGACAVLRCRAGYGDCTDGAGCETPLTTSSNCGACAKVCGVNHGTAQCVSGACATPTCDPGYGNCDTSNLDCETPLTTEAHCGACSTTCSGGTPLCATVAGKQTCVSDCAPSAPTKCGSKCVDVQTDKNNCGQCGKVCSFPNADASCVSGQCVMGGCRSGYGDCTNQPGCETALDSSSNCGRCGNSCAVANATSSCDGTRCTTPVCNNGYGNCNTSNPDCETLLNTPDHCGSCTGVCPTATPLCSSSTGRPTCVSDCTPSTPTKCGTACVSTVTDVQNCGMCGKVCSAANADSSCVNSACTFACRNGYGDCNAQPGCETSLAVDGNCGACGKTCSFPNADATCRNSACAISACKPGFDDCNTQAGCETSITTPQNCGRCGNICPVPANGRSTCVGGQCDFECTAPKVKCGNACYECCADSDCHPGTNELASCTAGHTCSYSCQPNTTRCRGQCKPGKIIGACVANALPFPLDLYWCDANTDRYQNYPIDNTKPEYLGWGSSEVLNWCRDASDDIFLAYCYDAQFATVRQSRMQMIYFHAAFFDADGKVNSFQQTPPGYTRTCAPQQ